MSDASGIGGSANELGSRHRAGVAAYLAIHGLVDRPLLGRPGAVPVALSLEAAEAVDDIVCRMLDETSWFLQSKRTAGNSPALRAAARQWALQNLADGDRVALVARRLQGILDGLQRQIEQTIRGDPITDSARDNVTTFSGILRDEGADHTDELLERVQLIEWRVEDPGDADLEAGIAMLAGTIVPDGQAPHAFGVLRDRMQLAASRRETTTSREWIDCLVEAGLEVYADGNGTRGARERARQLAVGSYRAMLASRENRLDLSALVTDVPEIVVDDALHGWEVSWDTSEHGQLSKTDVLNVARATPRFVIAGLPGMGKSELMRQIAARVAGEALAPLPVHIDLRHITADVHTSADLTLDLLLDRPSRSVTGQDPDVLKGALTDAVLHGDSILQIDGLDEAQRARGQVAAGLARLLVELPTETGLILTTRDSALPAANQLHLPLVRLETPGNLRDAMVELIKALAPLSVPAADAAEWAETKSEELTVAFSTHEDVWKVPLLATLATVRLVSGRGATTSVAVLLNQVIEDSVTEWELRRATGRDDLNPALGPEMLLAGFAAIGHELIGAASITSTNAVAAVRDSLHEWNLASPLENTIAGQIVTFWDERVGVFVDNGDGIVPRSRQFAELAEVRWLTDRDEAARREWLLQAIDDDGYENAVSLATSIDPVVRAALIDAATRESGNASRDRAATWLARQWDTWPDDPSQQLQVIDVLADAAEDRLPPAIEANGVLRTLEANRQRSDGGGWAFVLSLVNAPRHPDTDSHRRERLAALGLAPGRRSIVTALTGLIDAEEQARPLDAETLAAVEEVINTPRPAKPESRYNEEGVLVIGSSPSYVTGVGEIAERSIEFLDQLGADAPDTLHRVGRQQSMLQYGRISRRLLTLGYHDPEPLGSGIAFPPEWMELRDDHDGLGWLLRELDQLAPVGDKELQDSWRYPELGRLIDALGYAETSMAGFVGAAQEESAVLQVWLAAHIEAFRLDKDLLAREARQLLGAPDAEAASDSVIYGRRQPNEVPSVISEATALGLVPAFQSRSEWIVNNSFRLLTESRYPAVATALSEIPGPTSWRNRFERNVAMILNSADREAAVETMLESENTAIRAATGAILRAGFVPRPDLLDRLRLDPDGEVRHHSGGDPHTAEAWTCPSCGEVNPPDRTSCSRCHVVASWR